MPINRVPVVHKFGIISQTQREELEKRIAKKAFLETRQKLEAQQPPEPRPLPFEVTEDFVYKFNDSSQEDKQKQEDTAMKMLKRLKRLAGLRQAGEAQYVGLPRAWADLALLAQCRSPKLEEACLEALIASLDQALVSDEQILSLFYLAKSGVHWLKKDAGNQSVLRSSEILLLKMTRLVFTRLYCHHLLDQLKEYEDQRKSLGQYLRGLSEKAHSFTHFPGAYLSVRFICVAGRVICSPIESSTREELIQNESEERESNDAKNVKGQAMDKKENTNGKILDTGTQRGDSESIATVEDLKDHTQEDEGLKNQLLNKMNYDKDGTSGYKKDLFSKDNVSPSIETGKSLFLQCSLNVWHAVNHDPELLNDTLCDLLESATHLSQEQWLELVLAFHILSDASCNDARVLEAFQFIISQDFSPVFMPIERVPRLCETCYSSLPTRPEKKPRNSSSFRENLAMNESASNAQRNTTASFVETLKEFVGLDLTQESQWTLEDKEVRKMQDSPTYSGQLRKCEQEEDIHADSYAVLPRTKITHYRWPWELVYTFCECLTNICLHGACANIQKLSLLGMGERTFRRRKNGMQSKPGLVQFLQYDDGVDSWKVRYGAVKSLVRISRHYSNDVTKEGVTNTAWTSLMESQSSESEPRVLEAMKIAKVEAELEKKLKKDHIPVSLWTSRIASALTQILQYHIITTGSDTPASPIPRMDRHHTEKISIQISAPCNPERCKKPTLRQEVKLSDACLKPKASYNTRMNLELRAVIEDQWKKQLIQEMEDEIKTDIEQLDKDREQELERK